MSLPKLEVDFMFLLISSLFYRLEIMRSALLLVIVSLPSSYLTGDARPLEPSPSPDLSPALEGSCLCPLF